MRDRQPEVLAEGLAEVLALAREGRNPQALARAADLAAAFPQQPEPLLQWAVLLRLTGGDGAADVLTRCLALAPTHAAANRLMGEILLEQGRPVEAMPCLDLAVHGDPGDQRGWLWLAKAQAVAGHGEQALATIRTARQRWPGAGALADFEGRLHAARGAWQAAAEAFRAAAAADPRSASRLGDALLQQGMPGAAYLAYRRAERGLQGCPETGSRALFASQFLAGPPRVRLAAHRRWASRYAPGPLGRLPVPNPDPGRALRVALVSPRLRRSSAAFLLASLIDHWPSGLSLYCYAEQREEDSFTQRVRSRCVEWVDTQPMTDAALADRIAADQIDIAIDLAGHTPGNRLLALARRPAPIVLSWLDYCDTTGSDAFDAVITDAVHSPRNGVHPFAERLLRLDPLRFCYQPPAELPSVAPAGQGRRGEVVFGAFHRLAKLTPSVLAVWSRLLEALPSARLVIRSDALAHGGERALYQQRLAAAGLPVARVQLQPALAHGDYLAAYGQIDIALDTFPYNGGVTTLESLVMGRPVVALAGTTLIARQSAAILHALGLQDLVAESPAQYVSIAKALAEDPRRLGDLSSGLRERMLDSPVCDARGFARRFEALLREAWRARCLGAPIGEAV